MFSFCKKPAVQVQPIRSGFALDCVSKADELLKKCRERYEARWNQAEINFVFSCLRTPEEVMKLLKLKETYGQEVFWSQIFSDYKPFDAKDWLEDGESL